MFRQAPVILWLGFAFICWGLLHHQAFISAFKIWYISEIYTHGLFVLPICGYLLFRSRYALLTTPRHSTLTPIVLLLLLSLLSVAASIGRLSVIEHITAFASLPLIVLAFTGYQSAKRIWFPLMFSLFAIPIGDQLVPHLQNLTADVAVWMLKLTGIPVLRSGLYIEIPEGKFVVAEACSGIRFFIGSIVFGTVYAYVSFVSWPRRFIFVALSIVIPIVANALRVYGIILIGHLSNMQHAAGADHLVYGWLFFSIVIVLLVLLGETFSQHQKPQTISSTQMHNTWQNSQFKGAHIIIPAIFLLSVLWKISINLNDNLKAELPQPDLRVTENLNENKSIATPVMKGAQASALGKIEDLSPLVFIAYYGPDSPEAELISGENRLFDIERWSQSGKSRVHVDLEGDSFSATQIDIVSSWDANQKMIYWYQSSDWATGQARYAKIYQIIDHLLGGKGDGALVTAIYFDEQPSNDELKRLFEYVDQQLFSKLNNTNESTNIKQ